jgi:GH15 family glucan-1,4-alpha-glucosidase
LAESGVDASLLGLTLPYRTFRLDHPYIIETVQLLEKDIHYKNGGIYRYKEDVYYGGGEWVLLTAWLGWYYALAGEKSKAQKLLAWIESVAAENGDLPEQVNKHVLFPADLSVWIERWGPVATPLLWSHAMYLILYQTLRETAS